MPRFLVSVPARASVYVEAKSAKAITEAMVREQLGKFVELDVAEEVFTDEFEVLDQD